jgi:para-nitrobenzyl esterase
MERNARLCVRAEAKLGERAYLYNYVRVHPYVAGVRFADQNPATVGAYHTADIPYWFGTQDKYNMLRPTRNWTAWDRALSARMMGALIEFAATGDPGTPAMPWPAAQPGHERKLVLGDAVSVAPLDQARIDWMAAHPVARMMPVPGRNPRD